MKIDHRGSLMTHEVDGEETCLGFLITYNGESYEPSIGKIDVTPEEAETHNKLRDEAIVKGLDLCPVGQGNLFYVHKESRTVRTWPGTEVGEWFMRGKTKIVFYRNGNEKIGDSNLPRVVFEGRYTGEPAVFFERKA